MTVTRKPLANTAPATRERALPAAVEARLRKRYQAMQTPDARRAMQAAFDADPDELGAAAVEAAATAPRRRG